MAAENYTIPRPRLIERLRATGWLKESARVTSERLENIVREYQQFHGLKVDGWAGRVTERSLCALRFCGFPDRMELGARLCKWSRRELTWTITGALPGLSDRDLKAAYAQAWSYWEQVCGIAPQHTADQSADVQMGSGPIDAAGGTLAWSEMPCGVSVDLKQKYDSRESWVIADNPPPHRIDLVRVAAHEIGHALGIPHIGPGNLLAPTYSTAVRQPQAGDIAEAVKRYGRAKSVPAPTPAPLPPPAGGYITFNIDGKERTFVEQ